MNIGDQRTRVSTIGMLFLNLLLFLAGAGVVSAQSADRIGLYFDPAYTITDVVDLEVPHLATGYLVLHEPSRTEGGLSAWECRVEIDGDHQVAWHLSGNHYNYEVPPEFIVGMLEPLPMGSDVLLATCDILVADDQAWEVRLREHFHHPSVPDEMSYICWDDREAITVMTTTTGRERVATYNWVPACDQDRDVVDFGTVAVGVTASQVVTVTNTGSGYLRVAPDFGGMAGFGVAEGVAGLEIGVGESADIELTFAPVAETDYLGDVRLGASCGAVALSGRGRPPVYAATVHPDSLDLGQSLIYDWVGSALTIINHGDLPLEIAPEVDNPLFTFWPEQQVIPAGRQRGLNVSFRSHLLGEFSGSLDLGEHLDPVPLRARCTTGAGQIMAEPTRVDFGAVPVSGQDYQFLRLTNNTWSPVDLTWRLDDPTGAFSIMQLQKSGDLGISPGSTAVVEVRFHPTEAGPVDALLSFVENGLVVPLSGLGSQPTGDFETDLAALDYGNMDLGASVDLTVQLTNTGNGDLAVAPEITAAPGEPEFVVVAGGEPGDLGPGQTRAVTVRCRARIAGLRRGFLNLGENLPTLPCRVVAGRGGGGTTVEPATLAFGQWPPGAAPRLSVRLQNREAYTLQISPEILSGSHLFEIVDGAAEGTVAPFSTREIQIRFQPDVPGDFSAELGFGSGLPVVSMSASAAAAAPACHLKLDGPLQFPDTPVGETSVRSFHLANTGGDVLSLSPGTGGFVFQVLSAPDRVLPGATATVTVVFQPGEARAYEGRVDLGAGITCEAVLNGSGLPVDEGGAVEDRIAIYFDEDHRNNWSGHQEPGYDFEAYLVLHHPATADALVGWDLKVDFPGEFVRLLGVELAGGGVNYATMPALAVDLAQPLPGQESLRLATLRLVTLYGGTEYLPIAVVPRPESPYPGTMTCLAGDAREARVLRPRGGHPVVAWIADSPVSNDDLEEDPSLPEVAADATRLLPNVPNPFNPETTVYFELDRMDRVRIEVYDVMGRRVRRLLDEERPSGAGQVVWRGRDDQGRGVASGTYLLRMETARGVESRRVLLLK